jgi:glycosyltransferase involved in cell wall biosynthesis
MAKSYREIGAVVTVRDITIDIDLSYIFALSRYLKENKIDIVHAHDLKAGTNATLAAVLAGVKSRFTHVHTPISEWQVPNLPKRIFTTFAIKGYAFLVNTFVDFEIALTESRKLVKSNEGIRESKLYVIPNGKDLKKYLINNEIKDKYRQEIRDRYGIPQNAFVFGNISRMTPEKGHDDLIKVFSKILKTDIVGSEKLYLLLGGGGELESMIREEVRKLGLDDRIMITGIFEEEDNVKLYSSFDAFVFPSLAEGFGYVLIEAMGARLPILCSDLDVLKEVAGDSVLYFSSNNEEDFRLKMIHFYNTCNEGKYDLIDKAYNKVMKQYSLEVFIESYENLYKKVSGANQ